MSNRRAALSLYRRSLKLALDWAVHRHLWRGQALYIRSLFEANRNVVDVKKQRVSSSLLLRANLHTFSVDGLGSRVITDEGVFEIIQVLLSETEKLLETWKHPDPYCHPTAPGGSKYERNLPVHNTAPPPPLKF
ncbi:hypothetical protein NPX13_g5425 [Xylaria arbuscula]|uniref:NADH dehydrogenase [ubiquinone] 1 beta subcomplex subunit 9 n=1 Tax=Xylaria arbuscula TaxID=114810 RepID=A0A9W8NE17_9PEZI|nr:hypothetical protein NPX13_g5425 [Xylaria arbuscula]